MGGWYQPMVGTRVLAGETTGRTRRRPQKYNVGLIIDTLGILAGRDLNRGLHLGQIHQLQGVDTGAVHGEAPVQVWAGHATGGAHFTEDFTDLEAIAHLCGDLREVAVEGVNAKTV